MILWDWAVAAYGRPGAREACLALQDDHGQNVPLLLAAAWAGSEGRSLDETAAAALALDWESDVVGPLRSVRRSLKSPRSGVQDAPREALRAGVKAVELEAERVLLNALEALAGPPAGSPRDGALVLAAAASAWFRAGGFPLPPAAAVNQLATLICYDGPA